MPGEKKKFCCTGRLPRCHGSGQRLRHGGWVQRCEDSDTQQRGRRPVSARPPFFDLRCQRHRHRENSAKHQQKLSKAEKEITQEQLHGVLEQNSSTNVAYIKDDSELIHKY